MDTRRKLCYFKVKTADHCKIVKIGVEFSQKEKGVKRWLIE